VSTGKKLFLCRICYDNPAQSLLTVVGAQTNQIARHLTTHGFDSQGNKVLKRKHQDQEHVDELMERQQRAQSTVFNRSDWQARFVAWAVGDDISLEKTTSKRIHTLLTYRNPFIEAVLPQSRNTTRCWIMQAFHQSKRSVRKSLASSKSRITLSFDAWKSDNELDLLGVIAHYIDEHYTVKNVLLGLRNTYGSHVGEEQKHHLLAICREYQISNKIAYFMADNATNNDKTLELLQSELAIDAKKSRLRCAGHIINLVCKAILYGTDIDCVNDVIHKVETSQDCDLNDGTVAEFERVLRSKDELATLKAWRKKGPVGKLHNLIRHARSSPARRSFFISKQKEADPETKRLYHLVMNGGIRWNSTCDMIERSIKLRDALELYQVAFKDDENEPCADDSLTNDDWLELSDIQALLSPLKQASLYVQSNGKDCTHGSLFESLQTIDWLLTKLEELKQRYYPQPNTHFKACINLGWKKLDKYYSLSDSTPAYRAAVIIHPCFKMQWFEKHWKQQHPQWVVKARQQIEELYKDYKRRHGDEILACNTAAYQGVELSDFDRYNTIDDESYNSDELERYLREERASKDTNPITWWKSNQDRYPILKHIAFDHLAAPASSAADERQFSMADNVLNSEHYNTLDDLAEAHQCLKSAFTEGIELSLDERT
jgi:hypothetical protein